MSLFKKYLEMAISPDQVGTETAIDTIVNIIEKEIDDKMKKHYSQEEDLITIGINPSDFPVYKQAYEKYFDEITSKLREKYLAAGWSSFEALIEKDTVWGPHSFMGKYKLGK